MQQRLPDMGEIAIDQGDPGAPAATQRLAQAGSQFKATRTTSDDDDTMHRGLFP
jgi:hypothetical protein